MSSPPAMAETGDAPRNVDNDTEMEDTQDASATGAATARNTQNENSSAATLDHDFPQSDSQPAAGTGTGAGSSLLNNNRKDVTLREFLSKMDDYAPIVGPLLSCWTK